MLATQASTPSARSPAMQSRSRSHRLRAVGIRLGIASICLLLLRWSHIVESIAVYFPDRAPFQTPRDYQDVSFAARDGSLLHGWWMPATDAAPGERRPTILHVHGNAGNVESHAEMSAWLCDHGFHVFVFDYRGYGRSSPARFLSRNELLMDTHASLDHVLGRDDVDKERVGLFGVSLGGAFALGVAADRPVVRATCTVGTFSSFPDIAGDMVPVLGRVLMPTGLAGKDNAAHLHCPYLIVHGTADEVIPVSHASVLERAARDSKVRVERVVIDDADHNGIMHYESSRSAVRAFFEQWLQ